MALELEIMVLFIIIFILELIFGSMILKAVANLENRILQMIEFVCAMKRDLHDDNEIITNGLDKAMSQLLKNMITKNSKSDDHDFII